MDALNVITVVMFNIYNLTFLSVDFNSVREV